MTDFTVELSTKGMEKLARLRTKKNGKDMGYYAVHDKMLGSFIDAYKLIRNIAKERKEASPALSNMYGRTVANRQLKRLYALLDADPCWIDLDARARHDPYPKLYNLLHLAVETGQLDIAQKLIEKGAPIDSVSIAGTPLSQAIMKENVEMAAMLLAHGASPHPVYASSMEKELFHIAGLQHVPMIDAAQRSAEIILMLHQHGADVNVISNSPQHSAIGVTCWASRIAELKALLECGATPNLIAGGTTALRSAVENDIDLEYLSTLLDAGADMHMPNPKESAYGIAHNRHYDLQKIGGAKRVAMLDKRHDVATARWAEIQKGVKPSQITATDMVWCSNIGKLDELMNLPGWHTCAPHLRTLLMQVPPWMTEHIGQSQSALLLQETEAPTWTHRITNGSATERVRA